MAFSRLPSQAGVYWWLDAKKKVLYVGKAKNLKNRVSSYQATAELSPRIREMVTQAKYLQWRILPSEIEALLVEAELIRLYQPPFNVLLKDDKSPLYIVITKETWPRVLKMRKRDLSKFQLKPGGKMEGRIFGPFISAYKVTEVLKLVRPIFPWCNAPRKHKMRRCLENHLQLCPGVCTGSISQEDYQVIIDNLSLFLAGKTQVVQRRLKMQLRAAVQAEAFEKAAVLRDQLQLIAQITASGKHLKDEYFLPN
ncbi:MAG: GIY-YIG nuclease family protein, partial [bacterium]|nr:GIY-YIG nuclease family protein [bacterium]